MRRQHPLRTLAQLKGCVGHAPYPPLLRARDEVEDLCDAVNTRTLLGESVVRSDYQLLPRATYVYPGVIQATEKAECSRWRRFWSEALLAIRAGQPSYEPQPPNDMLSESLGQFPRLRAIRRRGSSCPKPNISTLISRTAVYRHFLIRSSARLSPRRISEPSTVICPAAFPYVVHRSSTASRELLDS